MYQTKAQTAMELLEEMQLYTNSAIIFDIDDPLLDSNRNPIWPIVELYYFAQRLGLTIFIVTNRSGEELNAHYTFEDLSSVGIRGYKSVYFRAPGTKNLFQPKLSARKHIFERGYQTVMSIGDQPCDVGEYGGVGVLLR